MAAYLIVMRSESIQDADAMAEYQRRTREIHPAVTLKPAVVYGAIHPLEGEVPDGIVMLEFASLLMDPGDRGLVARQRGRLAPLPGPRIEIVGDHFGGGRQRDAARAPAPQVEGLEVGSECAEGMRRGRRLERGDERFVDNEAFAGAQLNNGPRQIAKPTWLRDGILRGNPGFRDGDIAGVHDVKTYRPFRKRANMLM